MSRVELNFDINKKKREPSKAKRNFLVVKSNLYGFGTSLLKHITNKFDGFVFLNEYEYGSYSKLINLTNYEIILLYPDKNIFKKFIPSHLSFCLNNIQEIYQAFENQLTNKAYIRVDPFLGLHGITINEFYNIKNLHAFKGLLIHINEYLDKNEMYTLKQICHYASKHNLRINVGGSQFFQYEEKFEYNFDIRYTQKALYSLEENNWIFSLKMSLINKLFIKEPIKVGYKSDQKTISKGLLLLSPLGYGDFHLLPRIYLSNIPIKIQNTEFYLPCYPCMNTSWLYSPILNDIKDDLELFNDYDEVGQICEKLDIDLDEFFCNFSNFKKVYN